MSEEEKEPVVCYWCGAVNQHDDGRDGSAASCPYRQHRVHTRVGLLRTHLSDPQRATVTTKSATWLLDEMDRWAARWMAARNATIAAQYRAAEAIEIRFVKDADGCSRCAHFLERIGTCVGPKLQQARQLDAGVYVPPWCPGFKEKSDSPLTPVSATEMVIEKIKNMVDPGDD